MTILQSLFLGLVQGIAEFLPISSSGHLAIFQNLFGLTTAEGSHQFFDVLLHLGTLVSVCVVFWEDIVSIVRECVELVRSIGHPVPGERKRHDGARLLLMMFLTASMSALVPSWAVAVALTPIRATPIIKYFIIFIISLLCLSYTYCLSLVRR